MEAVSQESLQDCTIYMYVLVARSRVGLVTSPEDFIEGHELYSMFLEQ